MAQSPAFVIHRWHCSVQPGGGTGNTQREVPLVNTANHAQRKMMNILLLCHETPDCIVIDLGRRDALTKIARLRALHPTVDIVTCAATFDDEAVEAAKAAGTTDFAARSFVDQRVARRLKLAG
jgi:DNA-binding NarL/FixJ family response regulator